jgi:site-specific recombinase XerD
MASLSKFKRQGMVCGFFFFCIRQGWLRTNPMMEVGAIKVTQKPTDYFPRPEFTAIVEATSQYKGSRWGEQDARFRERLRTLTLLMRWSGLAIRDAVTLRRDRLGEDDSVFLYRAKTGEPVRVLLPPDVAKALREVPPGTRLADLLRSNSAAAFLSAQDARARKDVHEGKVRSGAGAATGFGSGAGLVTFLAASSSAVNLVATSASSVVSLVTSASNSAMRALSCWPVNRSMSAVIITFFSS